MPLTLTVKTIAECLRTNCNILGDNKQIIPTTPTLSALYGPLILHHLPAFRHLTFVNAFLVYYKFVGQVAQLVRATGWVVRDRIPVATKFSARPDRSWDPHSLLLNGYRVFPGGKVRLEHAAQTLLLPRSWKSRAIPLPTLWATWGL